MLHYIESIKAINTQHYFIDCLFNNEMVVRRIPVGELIAQYSNTPQIKALLEPQQFSQVALDSYGTLTWSNGIDFCPDLLYQLSQPVNN